jgi:hypothetical protein
MGAVVPAGQILGNPHEFGRNELEAFRFKPADYPTCQVPLHSVRLDDD